MALEYHIVGGKNEKALAAEVNRLISEGWLPLGGVAVDSIPSTGWYVQAMYRETGK
jgi:hypothetical protein